MERRRPQAVSRRGFIRILARLRQSTVGSSAVEYALLIGLLIGVLAIGAVLVGKQLDRTLARMGGDAASSHVSNPTSSTLAEAFRSENALIETRTASAIDRYSGYALMVAFGGLVLALVATCVRRLQPAKRTKAPDEEMIEGEDTSDSMQMRLLDKRQRLWRALLTDSDLVLKNRIEVRHLMTRDLTVVAPGTRLEAMNELLATNRVRHLLVCGGDGTLLGVISNRDLCGVSQGTAAQTMTPNPTTIAPGASLGAAINCLIQEGISCLPVVDGQDLCGVLTTTDLILTLQCTLQLWLRVAQAVRETPRWVEQLEKLSTAIDRSLADQRDQLVDFNRQIGRLEARCRNCVEGELSQGAEGVFAIGAQLAEAVDGTREQIRRYTDDLVALLEVEGGPLSGLNSLRELTSMIEVLLAIRDRSGQPVSVMLLAFDAPRTAADHRSSQETEGRLQMLADLIADIGRTSDFVARYEERMLAVVMPQTELHEARAFCHRLREAVHNDRRFTEEVDIRAGLAAAMDGDDSASLLDRAVQSIAAISAEDGPDEADSLLLVGCGETA